MNWEKNPRKDLATFAFARLQNSTSMTTAHKISHLLCTVLTGKHKTKNVLDNLKALKDLIKEDKTPKMEDTEKLKDTPLAQEEDDEDRRNAHTIVGRSPFTSEFKKVFEEVQAELEKDTPNCEENPYFCPAIVDVLFEKYLGIFPLWSGLLLGNLKRYASDMEDENFGPSKTRDTNCHVERWFGNCETFNSKKGEGTKARDLCKKNVWLSTGEIQRAHHDPQIP